jgi:hypothetical protein
MQNKKLADLRTINQKCSDFIDQRNGKPVYRRIPFCGTFGKIKLRFRQSCDVSAHVSETLDDVMHGVARRTVVGYTSPLDDKTANYDTYYLFIPNGFKCFYPRNFTDSASIETIRKTVDELISDPDDLIETIVKLDYYMGNSIKDIPKTTNEIAFFGVPCFYVVHADAYETYADLIRDMK